MWVSLYVRRKRKNGEPIVTNLYNYCPMCGENLKKDPVGTEIIWNERSIEELWGLENNET